MKSLRGIGLISAAVAWASLATAGPVFAQRGGAPGVGAGSDPVYSASPAHMPLGGNDVRSSSPPDPGADRAMATARHLDAVKHMHIDLRDIEKLDDHLDSELEPAATIATGSEAKPATPSLEEEVRECRKIQKLAMDLDRRMRED